MATLTAANPRFRYNADGLDAMAKARRLIDGDATFNAGQFLYQKNDGLVYTCESDADTGTGGIQFLAMETVGTALSVDTTRKEMAVITAGDVFEMNELDGTVAETTVGGLYGLDVTSNICTVDLGDDSNTAFRVVDPSWVQSPFIDDSADVKARLLVEIIEAVINAAIA